MKQVLVSLIVCMSLLGQSSVSAQIDVDFLTPGPDSSNYIVPAYTPIQIPVSFPVSANYPIGDTAFYTVTMVWDDSTTVYPTFPAMITGPQSYDGFAFTLQHSFDPGNYHDIEISYTDDLGNNDTLWLNVSATDNSGFIQVGVYLDDDNDGVGDEPLNGQIRLVGASSAATYVYANGSISGVNTGDGPYTASIDSAWLAGTGYVLSPLGPGSQSVDFSGGNDVVLNPFLLACNQASITESDWTITGMTGWGFRAGDSTGYLSVGTQEFTCAQGQHANLHIVFDSLLSLHSHNVPGGILHGDTLTAPFISETESTYTLYFEVPGPTPALTPLHFSATVEALGLPDANPADNTQALTSEVRNSWDPNDKSSNKPPVVSPTVQDEFTYMIRFQNMGNDDAFNIVIKDTLDADLDLSAFGLLELSHPGSVSVDAATRIVTFSFPNIFLPPASQDEPASHGYAIYKIKENAGLPIGTEITNTGYIYFDYNPPIITNTTVNTNQTSGLPVLATDNFSVYPVPASDFLTVVSKNGWPLGQLSLTDMLGKTVLVKNTSAPGLTVDTKTLATGIYTLRVLGPKGVWSQKVAVTR